MLIDQERIRNLCYSDDPEKCNQALEKFQESIRNLCYIDDPEKLTQALGQLKSNFSLKHLISNIHHCPRRNRDFEKFLGIYEEEYAFESFLALYEQSFHNLCYSKNPEKRNQALEQLKSNFSSMPNKEQAFEDLLMLILYQESIHNLCHSDDPEKRTLALEHLETNFSSMLYKYMAINDLLVLSLETSDSNQGYRAAQAYGSALFHFRDIPKENLIDGFFEIANNSDWRIRSYAAIPISSAFIHLPDECKKKAWDDLQRLVNDKNESVRASVALGSMYLQLPDEYKKQVWEDLHRLTDDENYEVRFRAVFSLCTMFFQMSEDYQLLAYMDLHRLTNDKNGAVRSEVAEILGLIFSQLPDKLESWNDLHKLTNDENSVVRSWAIEALGSAFPYIPDHKKKQALNDLYRGTNDNDIIVRAYANHSCGRVCTFRASQAEKEEEYKNELEKAIMFFEKTAQESSDRKSDPSKLCLPFYNSFYKIIFNEQKTKEEVNKYLEEAKAVIKGSKSKKLLFEAAENLAKALEDVQNLGNLDFHAMKYELNLYRKYCEHTAELMIYTDEKAPIVTKLILNEMPFFDFDLKKLIEEIQKKTEVIQEKIKGIQFNDQLFVLGFKLNKSSQLLSKIRDPVGFKKQLNVMHYLMKAICSKFPEGQKNEACELLEKLDVESSFEDQIPIMNIILSKLDYQLDMTTYLGRFEGKLDNISYCVFKTKLNNGNVSLKLDVMKTELEKLNEKVSSNTSSIEQLNPALDKKLGDINDDLQDRLNELEDLINKKVEG